ncbi:UDP-3-O-(3-hydroxymyristoyl)glucosamine N-acyltransferase [Helicobacter sp. 13S00482-2]|uniref:acyltransferase n=1 Tax=Helicobacter sp. 13S00482-2 TaxID=1476200 RepID=UPI000BA67CE6|nr:acyltransferase [Helicobacter sp. 13S00482-2]PAF53403.1 UDP-3-O-(3-hydroxymyristoyl)glucosamine N-acyltransferase [Helicobacter sp. 13S00482-2]
MKSQIKIIESKIVNVEYGENVCVMTPSNLYGCKLGNNVFIGPFVEIQKDVFIGDNTKIQSHSFICSLVSIGSNCFVAHGVMFINDLFEEGYPALTPSNWKKTSIGDNVSIGSNATILPVNICNNVVVGAGSVVSKDIAEPGVYAGNPAKKIRALKK